MLPGGPLSDNPVPCHQILRVSWGLPGPVDSLVTLHTAGVIAPIHLRNLFHMRDEALEGHFIENASAGDGRN